MLDSPLFLLLSIQNLNLTPRFNGDTKLIEFMKFRSVKEFYLYFIFNLAFRSINDHKSTLIMFNYLSALTYLPSTLQATTICIHDCKDYLKFLKRSVTCVDLHSTKSQNLRFYYYIFEFSSFFAPPKSVFYFINS